MICIIHKKNYSIKRLGAIINQVQNGVAGQLIEKKHPKKFPFM